MLSGEITLKEIASFWDEKDAMDEAATAYWNLSTGHRLVILTEIVPHTDSRTG